MGIRGRPKRVVREDKEDKETWVAAGLRVKALKYQAAIFARKTSEWDRERIADPTNRRGRVQGAAAAPAEHIGVGGELTVWIEREGKYRTATVETVCENGLDRTLSGGFYYLPLKNPKKEFCVELQLTITKDANVEEREETGEGVEGMTPKGAKDKTLALCCAILYQFV